MTQIWVLGSKHPKADKSIDWDSSFPNFSNADVLIINLQSLALSKFDKIEDALYNTARKYIFDMLMAGDKLVVAILPTGQSQLDWLPIFPNLRTIDPARLDPVPDTSKIGTYFDTVQECSYYIHNFDFSYCRAKTDPTSNQAENYSFTIKAREAFYLQELTDNLTKNAAKQTIGGYTFFKIHYGKIRYGSEYKYEGEYSSSRILFLPPPTKVSTEEAIDGLLSFLKGGTIEETSPEWASGIDLPGLKHLVSEVKRIKEERATLDEQINDLENKTQDIVKLRKLLWADGDPLEDTVKKSFEILGFPEMRRIRPSNLEDWIMDFKFVNEFKHGVFEVKGAENRTSMANLTQCNKWVEDYLLENVKVKGIFLTNQYRREELDKSLKKRQEFAPNELEYARTREICILPTYEVFCAVVAKMKGDSSIGREHVERRIASANGLCRLVRSQSVS